MKKIYFTFLFLICFIALKAQHTLADYKTINAGTTGFGDYTETLILLHEMYNGDALNGNYAIGTITALRGSVHSYNRTDIVQVNTTSSYNATYGSAVSLDYTGSWLLKTCLYNGKKYLAVEVPYADSFHDHGFKFSGFTTSTGENMKPVAFKQHGQAVNASVLTNVEDFVSNMNVKHDVQTFSITGNVGIGTESPQEKLSVNGKIRAKEVKVETVNWPDYVFDQDYKILGLQELEAYIKVNKHLPEIPSAPTVAKEGVELGNINKLLLKKIEELTLHLIEKDKQLKSETERNQLQDQRIDRLQKILEGDESRVKNRK